MAKPLSIALPPDHLLVGDYKIRVTAIDPDTGAVVAGVKVQNVTMQVENLSELLDTQLASGPFMLVPGPQSGV